MLLIGTEVSGSVFNELYGETKFYKFLNDSHVHFGFEYVIGLNIDTKVFNPNKECSKGGLYFCDKSQCHIHWRRYGHKLASITIPDDARVYIEKNKFKADRLIIDEITSFENVPDSFWIDILQEDPLVLEMIKTQTDEMCESAVKRKSLVLRYIKNQTNKICKIAVQIDGYALRYVKNQTEEICRLAIEQDESAIEFVKDQTEELCMMAVQKDGYVLKYIHDQTSDICKAAVKQNG